MVMGPVFRAMRHNKPRFVLIATQIAVTLAIVANCVTLVLAARRTMNRPPTFDEDNIVFVQVRTIDSKLRDADQLAVWHREFMARIRALTGVRAASASSIYLWLNYTLHRPIKAANMASESVEAATISADESLPDALGVTISEGRWFTGDEVEAAKIRFRGVSRELGPDGKFREPLVFDVVVTRELGEQIFGEGPLVGKIVEEPDGDKGRIIGVLEGYSSPAQTIHHERHAIFWAGSSYLNWGTWLVVRAESGKATELAPRINELVANFGETDESITPAVLISDMRQRYFGPQQVSVALMGLLIFLLLLVASVSTAGLTSFSVTERTRQIGVRRALGATTNDILRYFLTESGIVTTLGLAIGSVLAVLLNIAILRFYDGAKLSSPIVIGCALLLWFVALGAALPPALRASRISPAIATRSV